MKFLVLGCNGMLGHVVCLYLIESGYQVVGVARRNLGYGVHTITLDLSDLDYLSGVIRTGSFDVVVNCSGVLNQFAEERKVEAIRINTLLPHFLCEVTVGLRTRVIHISSDGVFSGASGKYGENSFKDGANFYSRTKALGEIETEKDLTIRTSVVGPDMSFSGIGLFNWFMKQKGEVQGFSRVIWTGQTNLQLAKTIEFASQQKPTGIYNVVPQKWITKMDLLRLFSKHCRNDNISIVPSDAVISDFSLVNEREGFEYSVPDYETMVSEMSHWIQAHSKLYPHYQSVMNKEA